MDNEKLIMEVIEQIKKDINNKDLTAITELLNFVPTINLEGFLSECDSIND